MVDTCAGGGGQAGGEAEAPRTGDVGGGRQKGCGTIGKIPSSQINNIL